MKTAVLAFAFTLLSLNQAFAQPRLAVETEGEQRFECRFESVTRAGMARCNAEVTIFQTRGFLAEALTELRVSCNDADLYHDEALMRITTTSARGSSVLFQGITSERNPTPPSLRIETENRTALMRADLTTSEGMITGRCRSR